MSGKKIDRKKQSLLSRSSKRNATIKKLTHKPVIKKIDIEAIKSSFKTAGNKPVDVTPAEAVVEKTEVAPKAESTPKKTRKPKKED
ncbi:MAG TPA: hypothetical protein VI583_18005 [Cyclobacteriaceae bacterium]|nr:hypothetical protein [Cyclobacteriaceae bacterium]